MVYNNKDIEEPITYNAVKNTGHPKFQYKPQNPITNTLNKKNLSHTLILSTLRWNVRAVFFHLVCNNVCY